MKRARAGMAGRSTTTAAPRVGRRWLALVTVLIATAAQGNDTPGVGTDFTIWRALLPLLIVTALGVAAWLALRYFQRSGWQRNGPVRVIQGLSLGPRERLVVVGVRDAHGRERRLLLGATPQHIRLLERLDGDESAGAEPPADAD